MLKKISPKPYHLYCYICLGQRTTAIKHSLKLWSSSKQVGYHDGRYWIYSTLSKNKFRVAPIPTAPTARNAVEYNMNHKKRGLAIIFNHEKFDQKNVPQRKGAEKDLEGLNATFGRLGFEVTAHWDNTINEVIEHTREAAQRDHTDHDCILIAICSHGDGGGYIHARNGAYCLDSIFQYFTADRCPSLAGKPKIFIIQACRGTKLEEGATLQGRQVGTDGLPSYSDMSYRIPLHADFLIAYSTMPGYVSWRKPVDGSCFIQALVKELQENSEFYDIFSILTFVNQRIAIDFESFCPDEPKKDYKKQMPCFTSMLTRILRLTNKSYSSQVHIQAENIRDTTK